MKTTYKNWKEYKDALMEGLNDKQARMLGSLMETSHVENIKAISDTKEANQIIVKEAVTAGDTTMGDISRYDMMFMPLIRRVMPALMAMELVGVQPQNGPRGIVRTLRFRYSETTEEGGVDIVKDGDEASGMSVYEKYSLLTLGGDYDDVDSLTPYQQELYLEGNRGKPMSLDVVTQATETKQRKLSAGWSLEAADDLMYLDGLDIEAEVSQSLGDEIMRELDRELLVKLRGLAGVPDTLDFANADGRYAGEKFSAVTIHIDDLSGQIAMATKKSGANWMVVPQAVYTVLKNANNSAFVPANQGNLQISSSLFVGTFGMMKVFIDPYLSDNTILLGYKGSDIDTGLVYAPYIALASSGVVRNPETGDQRVMLRTRYALHDFTNTSTSLGNSSTFYKKSTISNLTLGFVSPEAPAGGDGDGGDGGGTD